MSGKSILFLLRLVRDTVLQNFFPYLTLIATIHFCTGGEEGVHNLRRSLLEKNQGFTGLKDYESVRLQVSKYSGQQKEEFGRLLSLQGLKTEESALYDMYELFEKCEQHAQEHPEDIFSSKSSTRPKKNGNFVGAVGIAGIGKTSLEKLLLKDISDKTFDSNSALAFFVSIRDINFGKPMGVLQLLLITTHSDWQHKKEDDDRVLKHLNSCCNVYVFIDGLDEARAKTFDNDAPTMSLFDFETPDVILKNLFSGHILPDAKVMLASRPGAFDALHKKYKPDFVVKVLGLSEESQKELASLLCKRLKAEVVPVLERLEQNPVLSSLCVIPMFCKLLVRHTLYNKTSNALAGKGTVTDIFVSVLSDRKEADEDKGKVAYVLDLAKLGLHGFLNNQFYFDTDDFKQTGINQSSLEAFIDIATDPQDSVRVKIVDGQRVFFFVHLLWQEFFSAVELMLNLEEKKFSEVLRHFKEERWDSVVKFMHGLCNEKIKSKMEPLLQSSHARDFSEKRNKLMEFLKSFVENFSKNSNHSFPSLTTFFKLRSVDFAATLIPQPHDVKLFKICNWIFELGDSDEVQNIANSLPIELLFCGEILPADVTCLCHVLRCSSKRHLLSVGTYNEAAFFVGKGFDILLGTIFETEHQVC